MGATLCRLVTAALWWACAAAWAQPTPVANSGAEARVALVIGNATYQDAPLLNPVNDARAMRASLESAGFEVITRENATQLEMIAAIREFGERLKARGGVGLFYFAGHGMQVKGRNFLVPVGSRIQHEDEVAARSVDASQVLDKMEAAGNRLNMLILDACRNNPFARSFRSSDSGLAQMDAPVGTMIAFATAPGAVAVDGDGTNGLYTRHLLKALQQPGAKVEDVFKRVRAEVRRESKNRQIPWETTSLEGDFYFHPPIAAVKAAEPAVEQGAASAVAGAPARSALSLPSTSPLLDVPRDDPAARLAPTYKIGDRWTYRTRTLTSVSEGVPDRTVEVIGISGDGEVRFSDGERRAADGTLASAGSLPQRLRTTLPFPIREGQRFVYETGPFTSSAGVKNTSRPITCTVGEYEAVDVPLGRVGAWRIECDTRYTTTSASRNATGLSEVEHTGTVVLWYSPLAKRYVKAQQQAWAGNWRYEGIYEMTSATLH